MLFFGTLHSDGSIFPFLLCLSCLFFSQLFIRPFQTGTFTAPSPQRATPPGPHPPGGKLENVKPLDCPSLVAQLVKNPPAPSNHLILCHPLLLGQYFPVSGSFSVSQFFRIRWPWSYARSVSATLGLPPLMVCVPSLPKS